MSLMLTYNDKDRREQMDDYQEELLERAYEDFGFFEAGEDDVEL